MVCTFEKFTEMVKEEIKEYLPEEMAGATVTINKVTKNNGLELTALTVLPEGQNVAPNIYLEQFFESYTGGGQFYAIMKEIANICMEHIHPSDEIGNIGELFKDVNFVKERVIMVAIGTEQNAKLLSDVPHTNREDLALIYKVLVSNEDVGTATITIHNNHLEFWGMTVEELHEYAMKNTRELLPVTVKSMAEIAMESMGMMREDLESMLCDIPEEDQMYIISNQSKVNGAASMFYEDILSELAERIGGDLYILPSSVHECIAVSTRTNTPSALAEMVNEVNQTQVAPEERLSDHVYYYNAQEKKLTLAA